MIGIAPGDAVLVRPAAIRIAIEAEAALLHISVKGIHCANPDGRSGTWKASPTRYRTTNWSDYNAALRKRGSLSVWFDSDMVWHAEKSGKRGRPETFSDAAIQTCLTLKVLFGLPLRQTVGLVESLIRIAGLDWPVPDYSTLCRRQARITVQIPYHASGRPLNLLVDNEP